MENKDKKTVGSPIANKGRIPSTKDLAIKLQSEKKLVLKNKIYRLSGADAKTPFVHLQSEDRPGRGKKRLLYFDEKTGRQRAVRYVMNFDSPFVDEQDNSGASLAQEHITFSRGYLTVDKHQVSLQNFLDVHPWNSKNEGSGPLSFYEHDPEAVAKIEVDLMMLEAKALAAALDADIATTEAVLRPALGETVHAYQTDRLTRELMLMAKRTPTEFLEAIGNDKLLLENVAYTSIDYGVCKLADNGTTYRWAENSTKLVAIPFGNNPYKFIGEWFTSDEGLEVMNKITQKIKKQ